MKRLIFAAALALALPGCAALTPLLTGVAPAPPAPLAATTIDDKAVRLAFAGLETVADMTVKLIDAGAIAPGSPRALKIADALDRTRDWLNIASSAQRLGQTENYAQAMGRARDLFVDIKAEFSRP